jgi:hypothetical protein
MTLQEFKAWFEGFTEAMYSKPPTAKQWQRIQARVKEIDGTAVSYPVFVDRYWPRTYPAWPYYTGTSISCAQTALAGVGWNTPTTDTVTLNVRNDGHEVWNSAQAMCALGRADAAEIAA